MNLEGREEVLCRLEPGPVQVGGELRPQGQVPVESRHTRIVLLAHFSHLRCLRTVGTACGMLLKELRQTNNIISLRV